MFFVFGTPVMLTVVDGMRDDIVEAFGRPGKSSHKASVFYSRDPVGIEGEEETVGGRGLRTDELVVLLRRARPRQL